MLGERDFESEGSNWWSPLGKEQVRFHSNFKFQIWMTKSRTGLYKHKEYIWHGIDNYSTNSANETMTNIAYQLAGRN